MLKLIGPYLIALVLFTAQNSLATEVKKIKTKASIVLHVDTSTISVRTFNKRAIDDYSKQNEFRYNTDSYTSPSWWGRFWNWVWYILRSIIHKLFGGKTSWRIFGYFVLAVAIGLLIFVILKVAGIDLIKLFRGESSKVDIPYTESLENIHEISFEQEIENAIMNKNYRMAVRLLYLQCLKQLSDMQLIHWQIEKTNSAYIAELTNDEYREPFKKITNRFDYIWYGDFPLDEQGFQRISVLFREFKQKVV